jgi:hypothetical protein
VPLVDNAADPAQEVDERVFKFAVEGSVIDVEVECEVRVVGPRSRLALSKEELSLFWEEV